MTGFEAAVRHEQAHQARRAAAYVPSLLRPWPERRPPGDTSEQVRDPLRRRRADDELREIER